MLPNSTSSHPRVTMVARWSKYSYASAVRCPERASSGRPKPTICAPTAPVPPSPPTPLPYLAINAPQLRPRNVNQLLVIPIALFWRRAYP